MTLPRFPVCPGIPGCVGRPQTDTEWMVDRGVEPVRAAQIVASRERAKLGSLVLPPDPTVLNVPPYGAPERRQAAPPPTPTQEALF